MSPAPTIELALCDEHGRTNLETLNRFLEICGLPLYEGEPFACTGSMTAGGEHIRCSSIAHSSWASCWRSSRTHHREVSFVDVIGPAEPPARIPITIGGDFDRCLTPGCGKRDGLTEAGGVYCHDCVEARASLCT